MYIIYKMSDNELSEIGPYQIRLHSPDQSECRLDLNEHLIQNPESTFFLRFQGNSIKNDGIFRGDILVVDRSKPVEHGNLLIVILNGIFTMRRLTKQGNLEGIEVWGTVSSIIHNPNSNS